MNSIKKQKSLAEFAARRRQKIEIIFHRDMCMGKNTSQAASVEFCRLAAKLCAQQTVSLLSENSGGIFDSFYYTPHGGIWQRPRRIFPINREILMA
ncbi:MAG: hypothetical protein KH544_02610 [Firmicutes bacterium]|nr:hypothetical protein [Bacillota bacterium]